MSATHSAPRARPTDHLYKMQDNTPSPIFGLKRSALSGSVGVTPDTAHGMRMSVRLAPSVGRTEGSGRSGSQQHIQQHGDFMHRPLAEALSITGSTKTSAALAPLALGTDIGIQGTTASSRTGSERPVVQYPTSHTRNENGNDRLPAGNHTGSARYRERQPIAASHAGNSHIGSPRSGKNDTHPEGNARTAANKAGHHNKHYPPASVHTISDTTSNGQPQYTSDTRKEARSSHRRSASPIPRSTRSDQRPLGSVLGSVWGVTPAERPRKLSNAEAPFNVFNKPGSTPRNPAAVAGARPAAAAAAARLYETPPEQVRGHRHVPAPQAPSQNGQSRYSDTPIDAIEHDEFDDDFVTGRQIITTSYDGRSATDSNAQHRSKRSSQSSKTTESMGQRSACTMAPLTAESVSATGSADRTSSWARAQQAVADPSIYRSRTEGSELRVEVQMPDSHETVHGIIRDDGMFIPVNSAIAIAYEMVRQGVTDLATHPIMTEGHNSDRARGGAYIVVLRDTTKSTEGKETSHRKRGESSHKSSKESKSSKEYRGSKDDTRKSAGVKDSAQEVQAKSVAAQRAPDVDHPVPRLKTFAAYKTVDATVTEMLQLAMRMEEQAREVRRVMKPLKYIDQDEGKALRVKQQYQPQLAQALEKINKLASKIFHLVATLVDKVRPSQCPTPQDVLAMLGAVGSWYTTEHVLQNLDIEGMSPRSSANSTASMRRMKGMEERRMRIHTDIRMDREIKSESFHFTEEQRKAHRERFDGVQMEDLVGGMSKSLSHQLGRTYYTAVETLRSALAQSVGFNLDLCDLPSFTQIDDMLQTADKHTPSLRLIGCHGAILYMEEDTDKNCTFYGTTHPSVDRAREVYVQAIRAEQKVWNEKDKCLLALFDGKRGGNRQLENLAGINLAIAQRQQAFDRWQSGVLLKARLALSKTV